MVIAALSDTNDQVRAAARLALVNLADDTDPMRTEPRVDTDTFTILAGVFSRESSAFNRNEIARVFALAAPEPSEVRVRFVDDLMKTGDEQLFVYGILGAGRLRLTQHLPSIVQAWQHPSQKVRLAAPQALVAFGLQASPYLPRLRVIASNEKDALVKRTMDGALDLLMRVQ